jgi:4-amino-4-deoxy-L-arabinose transferase-like glycosyltransferase
MPPGVASERSAGDATPGAGARGRGPIGPTWLWLIALAAVLFAAGLGRLTLPSLDDCFYARKGVEMARQGWSMTVTWDGAPTFQNPPLPFWLMGLAMRALGESDVAARVPSLIAGLLTLWLIGLSAERRGGRLAAWTAVALLLVTPEFGNAARRAMVDISASWWAMLGLLPLTWPRRPRWWAAALIVGIGGAVLSKSVVGLLPAVAVLMAWAISRPASRPSLPALAGVIGLGTAIGASWFVHQWLTIGPGALSAHFGEQVYAQATVAKSLLDRASGVLRTLAFFLPVVVPGLVATVVLARDASRRRDFQDSVLLAVVVMAVAAVTVSSAQSPRYVFVLYPVFALLGGEWCARVAPRAAALCARVVVPVLVAAVTVVFFIAPARLSRDPNRVYVSSRAAIQTALPAGRQVPYFGERYWTLANPLLFYCERRLAWRDVDAVTFVASVKREGVGVVDADAWPKMAAGAGLSVRFSTPGWVAVEPGR